MHNLCAHMVSHFSENLSKVFPCVKIYETMICNEIETVLRCSEQQFVSYIKDCRKQATSTRYSKSYRYCAAPAR